MTSSLSIKWFDQENTTLSMSKKDVELNEFIEEVTDGTYKLTCKEVILKIVKELIWMHD